MTPLTRLERKQAKTALIQYDRRRTHLLTRLTHRINGQRAKKPNKINACSLTHLTPLRGTAGPIKAPAPVGRSVTQMQYAVWKTKVQNMQLKKGAEKRRRKMTPNRWAGLVRWLATPEGAAHRAAALTKANAARKIALRCGAKAKHTGQPCKAIALENGRCKHHGGMSTKGDNWNVARLGRDGLPIERAEKKIRELARRRERQAARVAAMTPEERVRYDAWCASHKPGRAADRAAARHDRDAAAFLANLDQARRVSEGAALGPSEPFRPHKGRGQSYTQEMSSAELSALRNALERQLERVDQPAAKQAMNEGVFG